jgi:FHS family L-fucose permease-like MFS transporter
MMDRPLQIPAGAGQTRARGMTAMVISLFFVWGFVTVLNDPLIAKLKGLFALNYAEAMLTQFAFFLGYFLFSIPAGLVLARLGYIRTIVLGLVVMGAGCVMFAPAAMAGTYIGFLAALFVVAAGITILQVAANPYIAVLGPAATASSRLTLAQAFNSLGTFLAPFVGALFLLQNGVATPAGASHAALNTARVAEASLLLKPFLAIAAVLFAMALAFFFVRRWSSPAAAAVQGLRFGPLLKNKRLMLGVGAIFLYVGAEVSIGSGLTNYLMQPAVIGGQSAAIGLAAADMLQRLSGHPFAFNGAQIAGAMVSIYWGFAMIGRFIGSAVLAKAQPGKVLAVHALAAMGLALISWQTTGLVAALAVLVIGFANSVMFPTVFTLALEGQGEDTSSASSLLCMAIVGGALVPVAYGAVADIGGLGFALLLPAACYLLVSVYGWYCRIPVRNAADA